MRSFKSCPSLELLFHEITFPFSLVLTGFSTAGLLEDCRAMVVCCCRWSTSLIVVFQKTFSFYEIKLPPTEILKASPPLLLNLFSSIPWNQSTTIQFLLMQHLLMLMVLDCCCCCCCVATQRIVLLLTNIRRKKRAISQNSDIKKAEKGQKKGRK
jgi:hypothetical protein